MNILNFFNTFDEDKSGYILNCFPNKGYVQTGKIVVK